jgi:hypothetical protein
MTTDLACSFFVVAFAVTFAYSLLAAVLVRPGTTASRLVLLSDVVIYANLTTTTTTS